MSRFSRGVKSANWTLEAEWEEIPQSARGRTHASHANLISGPSPAKSEDARNSRQEEELTRSNSKKGHRILTTKAPSPSPFATDLDLSDGSNGPFRAGRRVIRPDSDHIAEQFFPIEATANAETAELNKTARAEPTADEKRLRLLRSQLLASYENRWNSFNQLLVVLDADKDGALSHAEFKRGIVERFRVDVLDSDFDILLDALDPDHSGLVSFARFSDFLNDTVRSREEYARLQAGVRLAVMLRDEELRKQISERVYFKRKNLRDVFQNYFMVDNDGNVSYTAFRKGLTVLLVEMTDEEFGRQCEVLDPPRKGYITYANFCNYVRFIPGVPDVQTTLSTKKSVEALADELGVLCVRDSTHLKSPIADRSGSGSGSASFASEVSKVPSPSSVARLAPFGNAYSVPTPPRFNVAALTEEGADSHSGVDDGSSSASTPRVARGGGNRSTLSLGFGNPTKEDRFQRKILSTCAEMDPLGPDTRSIELQYKSRRENVVKKLSQVSINLRELFRKFDTNNDGFFDLADWESALGRFNLHSQMSDDERNRLFAEVDANKSGRVDYHSFTVMFDVPKEAEPEETVLTPVRSQMTTQSLSIRQDLEEQRRSTVDRQRERKLEEVRERVSSELRGKAAHVLTVIRTKIDLSRSKTLAKNEMRRLFNLMNLFVNETELELYYSSLDPERTGLISYEPWATESFRDPRDYDPVDPNTVDSMIQSARSAKFNAHSMNSSVVL